MADSLKDLMPQGRFEEPEEIRIIKNFVQEKYNFTPVVTIKPAQIIITVSGSALAGALRMQLHVLTELCSTNKKLVIRIQAF